VKPDIDNFSDPNNEPWYPNIHTWNSDTHTNV